MTKHNITCLIGNGFDMDILSSITNKKNGNNKKQYTTSYDDFYEYLKRKYENHQSEILKKNILVQEMKNRLKSKKNNWSDFEEIVGEFLTDSSHCYSDIAQALDELQIEFSHFLNSIVTPQLLEEVDNAYRGDSKENSDTPLPSLGVKSLAKFLGDLTFEQLDSNEFVTTIHHNDLLNFTFFNFNYTSLFDSYIYLDKNSFDPHEFKSSNNNFSFYLNPNFNNKKGGYPQLSVIKQRGENKDDYTGKYEGKDKDTSTQKYCNINTTVIHPHGYQYIPRSMLFGTSTSKNVKKSSPEEKKLIKAYWARNEENYSEIIDQSELFIIYGMSLGKSDSFWWERIADCIENNKAEVIIYSYNTTKKDDAQVIHKFLKVANKDNKFDTLKKNIFVVHGKYRPDGKKFAFDTVLDK
ncbi:MAG: bacteriophage abortive infection AbiH family protein [Ligilactobacillus animalis]|uniref:AbiH family protein n=1 Tax=Ligilactobacillus animalis TaxID=1605 RepID=UPI0024316D37|nr:AbiH family protein [Ligilactobacillus animalis]MCI5942691.1 bacteriophage abortive infection AbiH family protein [Ligilactobacillus animalis]MDY2993519.1 AbiH family protein [Ligilactobacillus animalis]